MLVIARVEDPAMNLLGKLADDGWTFRHGILRRDFVEGGGHRRRSNSREPEVGA
jgi:hypothetical protein